MKYVCELLHFVLFVFLSFFGSFDEWREGLGWMVTETQAGRYRKYINVHGDDDEESVQKG